MSNDQVEAGPKPSAERRNTYGFVAQGFISALSCAEFQMPHAARYILDIGYLPFLRILFRIFRLYAPGGFIDCPVNAFERL